MAHVRQHYEQGLKEDPAQEVCEHTLRTASLAQCYQRNVQFSWFCCVFSVILSILVWPSLPFSSVGLSYVPQPLQIFYPTLLYVLVTQPCLTLGDPMDCRPPGSSVHGISQARILEWVAMPSSRGSSQPRDQNQNLCIVGRFFTI